MPSIFVKRKNVMGVVSLRKNFLDTDHKTPIYVGQIAIVPFLIANSRQYCRVKIKEIKTY
jgi:hypothetical protein